jgi:hypothetical protein
MATPFGENFHANPNKMPVSMLDERYMSRLGNKTEEQTSSKKMQFI